jgi:hypothetical protein
LLATKLKARIVRNTATPTGVADRFGEPSQYASLPNRLSALATPSGEQHALIRSSLPGRRTHQTGSTLLAEGEQTPNPTFILSGWAARTRRRALLASWVADALGMLDGLAWLGETQPSPGLS